MHGVGFYTSINHILEEHFPADKNNWGQVRKSADEIRGFLYTMEREAVIELHSSFGYFGMNNPGAFPTWLNNMDVQARITGIGTSEVRNDERELQESRLRQSIIEANNAAIEANNATIRTAAMQEVLAQEQNLMAKRQTKLLVLTFMVTGLSALIAGFTLYLDIPIKQEQQRRDLLERMKDQSQSPNKPKETPSFAPKSAKDSSRRY